MCVYIVEISCQLLDVLLQLIRCLQAILEETAEQEAHVNFSDINLHCNKYD